jgi:hypothetical protein
VREETYEDLLGFTPMEPAFYDMRKEDPEMLFEECEQASGDF